MPQRPWLHRRGASEQGSAILLVMIVMSCVLAAGTGLLTVSAANRAMSANFSSSTRAGSAADAVASYAVMALVDDARWAAALQAGGASSFADLWPAASTSWGQTLNLADETAELQRRTDGRWARGSDTPVWRLFAWGQLSTLIDTESPAASPYVLAWVADNPADGDGSPDVDRDGVLVIRAEARLGLSTRAVEVFVKRETPDTSVTEAAVVDDEDDAAAGLDGLAQILPNGTGSSGASASGARLRLLSWRDVS